MKKIKRLYIEGIHTLLRLYWFIFRPTGNGVKAVLCQEGKVLMVRHNYGHKLWTFPGGGVKRGEVLEVAIKREVNEELGIVLETVVHIGTYETNYEHKQVTVDCYMAEVTSDSFTVDGFEIAEGCWFSPEALPDNRASSVDKIMAMFSGTTEVSKM
jgi:ADP-ribose pyrophosphatase YjhB (NUDIX family)